MPTWSPQNPYCKGSIASVVMDNRNTSLSIIHGVVSIYFLRLKSDKNLKRRKLSPNSFDAFLIRVRI